MPNLIFRWLNNPTSLKRTKTIILRRRKHLSTFGSKSICLKFPYIQEVIFYYHLFESLLIIIEQRRKRKYLLNSEPNFTDGPTSNGRNGESEVWNFWNTNWLKKFEFWWEMIKLKRSWPTFMVNHHYFIYGVHKKNIHKVLR